MTYTAQSLAKHCGISLRTLNEHLKHNVCGIAKARQRTLGLRGYSYPADKCKRYITEVKARTGGGVSTHESI